MLTKENIFVEGETVRMLKHVDTLDYSENIDKLYNLIIDFNQKFDISSLEKVTIKDIDLFSERKGITISCLENNKYHHKIELSMKAILKYIDENTGVKIDQMDNTISLTSTDLYTVVSSLSENGEFTPEEVAYNTLLCERFGYINCRFERNSNGNSFVMGKCPITDTTPRGESFLRGELTL